MKKLFTLGLAITAIALSGCYQTQEGRFKPGVPMVSDTIESKYERTPEEVYEAARKALSYNGTVTADNQVTRTLIARIDNRTVWVRVDQAEANITRIITQARTKAGTGDIQLAAEMDKQTALNLRVLPSGAR